MKKVLLIALSFCGAFVLKSEKAPETERTVLCQLLHNQKTELGNQTTQLEQLLGKNSPAFSEKSAQIHYNLLKLKLTKEKQKVLLELEKLNQNPEVLIQMAIASVGQTWANRIKQMSETVSEQEEMFEKIRESVDNASTEPITKESIRKSLEEKRKKIDSNLAQFPTEAQFIAAERAKFAKDQNQNEVKKLLQNQAAVLTELTELYEHCINQKSAPSSYKMQQPDLKTEIPNFSGKF